MPGTPTNPLGMSDEDFLKQSHPPEAGGAASEDNSSQTDQNSDQQAQIQDNQNQGASQDGDNQGTQSDADEGDSDTKVETAAENASEDGSKAGTDANADGTTEQENAEAQAQASEAQKKEGDSSPGSSAAEGADDKTNKVEKSGDNEPPNFEALYGKIMAPFQANGKKIELKSPEEAIQLMQMGANYTRKLQEMAPHRKLITMLGNHGLLDESKLSFFIALDKKDPEAIKKLIMDSGIDPLDIDTKIEPAYQEGSYQVTDQEVAFRTQLDDLTSTDEGKLTLKVITNDWDQVSKDMLWEQPEVFPIIRQHRESGIYTMITEEMDRRRTLGQLPPTTPFIEAYKVVGDELDAQGAFKPLFGPEQGSEQNGSGDSQSGVSAEKPTPAVVATRAAAPRPTVDNGDKAGAASPTRTAPGKAAEFKNPLAMSDDDFMKANGLEGRV